jgi:hypothetical protein
VLYSTKDVWIRFYSMPSFPKKYEESLKMAPFEILYGRRCWTLVFWNKAGELNILDPTYYQKAKDKYVW